VNWSNFPALLARSYSERWALKAMRLSCEGPATSSVVTVSLSLSWVAFWQMHVMEIFVVAKKYQRVLFTTYDRESMLGKSWSLTRSGLGRVPSCQFSAC
jgi:hypothetical protein